MGCPDRNVSGHGRGAALLKDTKKASEIVYTVKKKIDIPLSVKLRLGWERFDIQPLAKELERSGADAVTVHGRTKKQGFSGSVDWNAIGEIKSILDVPVICNGDINNIHDDEVAREVTKCEGIMVGRGALGKPWIFSL